MEGLTKRLANIFASEPENAGKAAALLLVLYVATIVPAMAVLLASLLKPIKPVQQDVLRGKTELKPLLNGHAKHNDKEELISPEKTALLIKTRRSIFPRDFSDEKVDRKDLEAMLEAANWAPTHGKNEPWRYVVLDNAAYGDFIDVMKAALNEDSELSEEAREKIGAKLEGKKKKQKKVQYAVMICYKRYAGSNVMPEWEELAATSTSVQNLHLMATSLGVSGYWTSSGPEKARDSKKVKSWLGLDSEDRCIGAFLVGKSDRADNYRPTRGPWQEKVTWKVSELN